MLPLLAPPVRSVSMPGLLFVRSLPRTWSIGLKFAGLRLIGAPNVAPLSWEMAMRSPTPVNVKDVLQTMYASLLPLPAKRGFEDWPSPAAAPTINLLDHVGATAVAAAVAISSEYTRLISTPPGANA